MYPFQTASLESELKVWWGIPRVYKIKDNYFNLFIFIFFDRHRDTEIFYSLVRCPNVCNGSRWGRTKPGARTQSRPSKQLVRSQRLKHHFCFPGCPVSASSNRKWSPDYILGTPTGNGLSKQHLNNYAKHLPSFQFFKINKSQTQFDI